MSTSAFDKQVEAARKWFDSPRFKGIVRLYSAADVAEQQGTIQGDYAVARSAAEGSTPGCGNCSRRAGRSPRSVPTRPARRSA